MKCAQVLDRCREKRLIIKMSCEDHLLRKGRALKPGLKKPGPKTGLLSLSSVLRFSVLLHFPLSSSFCLLFSRLDCVSDNETRKKKKAVKGHSYRKLESSKHAFPFKKTNGDLESPPQTLPSLKQTD